MRNIIAALLKDKMEEIANKWKLKMAGQNVDSIYEFYKLNKTEIFNDVDDLFDITKLQEISTTLDDGTIISTDFTDESKTLEVWKALGFEEEDFYK